MRFLLLVGLLSVFPLPALAQSETDPEDLEEDARLRFELGQRAYERGDFADAAEEFEEAYRLSNRPALLYNTYVAHRDAQDRPSAAAALRRFIAAAPDAPNRERLQGILQALEAEIARGGTAAASPVSRGGGGGGISAGPFVLIGGGVAVGIVAAITGGLALAANDSLTGLCPGDVCADDDAARGTQSDVMTFSVATDILWPTAVAVGAAGLIWLIVEATSSGGESATASAFDAMCDPGGCVARVGGTF